MRKTGILLGLMLSLPLSACMATPSDEASRARPVMGWDHRPEAAHWTESTLVAVSTKDAALAKTVPRDIETWCPDYANATMPERRAFWTGMLSAVARYESSWNPKAAGGGGRWIGLTQISPQTARGHGCDATSPAALKDGAANLSCAVEIIASAVGQDGMVVGNGRQGLGRDWMPFRDAGKRAAMAAWIREQSYCQ
ncbi:transglycosylase SLT domain-containing protein [Paracoccaceae bacterium Fryx2]|nr:transglycosylase SLT domain-containing protein [Paracoccaceae bacterium Fryx2]